jgi:UDP-2,4-diacetamido-2,4,6-trideoxy-beta-L-altropyranose hydrolase
MRCLTLADALRPFAETLFVCRHLLPAQASILAARNQPVYHLAKCPAGQTDGDLKHSKWLDTDQEQDARETADILNYADYEWLVIDHYALDHRFETRLRGVVRKILVIDDLADRRHDCDVLIDQNPYEDMQTRYAHLVPATCQLFLGPRYAFLREEFLLARQQVKARSGRVKKILIYFGGVDQKNYTSQAIAALLNVAASRLAVGEISLVVVIGFHHPAKQAILDDSQRFGFSCHVQTTHMASLMAEADLAIGAGGISTFERLYLRLPALLIAIADNQLIPLHHMQDLGFFTLYDSQASLEKSLAKALEIENVSPPDCVESGVACLVALMTQDLTRLQIPTALDVRRTYWWLQDQTLRHDFQVDVRPERASHFNYWRKLLNDQRQKVFAIYHGGQHAGNCGLKNIDHGLKSCELWIYLGAPAMRGKGVARAAVSEMKRRAKEDFCCRKIYLHVARQNQPAIKLYESTGFTLSVEKLLPPWENCESDMQKMECLL